MENVQTEKTVNGKIIFYIDNENTRTAEMEAVIADGLLMVLHTEVKSEAEGKGFAKKLLSAMVDHAKANNLKVLPQCSYVHAQFKRHPEKYADIWNNANE